MLRAFFSTLSKAAWAQRTITSWPVAWRAASRFVAGEQPEDAIRAIRELNAQGIAATLDHLGENTTNPQEAAQATSDIQLILDEIDRAGVRSNVSIKLSQIGLLLDQALCRDNLARILAHAQQCSNFVRIDMEDSSCVDRTLDLYREMRARGLANVGVAIQSYLYRSGHDVSQLMGQAPGMALGTRVRLIKGAYREPVEVAYRRKADVDANFDRLTKLLMDSALAAGSPARSPDGHMPPIPAIATHDDRRIAYARSYAQSIGLPRSAVEFQMLYGIRRDLQERLAAEGYPVRVYVPFGARWYPYFMRRLAERPANVWFFVSNYLRR